MQSWRRQYGITAAAKAAAAAAHLRGEMANGWLAFCVMALFQRNRMGKMYLNINVKHKQPHNGSICLSVGGVAYR